MTSQTFRSLLFIVLFATPFASAAHAAVAVLEQLSGNPTIFEVGQAGARTVSLPRQGAEYALPIEIETGPRDTATFRLPDSEVSVAPNTVMRVAAPEPGDGGLLQRIFQKAGASLFSVDRRDVEHFRVETPFLVSVVKGTTFNVVVHADGATVSLHEGRLQVDSVDGSQRVELAPGDVAFSGRDGALQKLEYTVAQQEPLASGATTADTGGSAAPVQHTLTGQPEPGDVPALQASMVDVVTSDSIDDIGGLAADIGAAGSDLVSDIGATSSDLVGDDLVGDLGITTGDLVGDLGDTTGDLVGDVASGDIDAGDTVGDVAGDLGDTTEDVVGDVTDTTGDVVDGVAGTTEEVTDDLTDAAGDITGGVADTTEDLTDSIEDAGDSLTEDLGDGLEETVDGVGGALGGVLGGLRL